MPGMQGAALDPMQAGTEHMSQWKSGRAAPAPAATRRVSAALRIAISAPVRCCNAETGGGTAVYLIAARGGRPFTFARLTGRIPPVSRVAKP
jgi:hypothetical protein